MIYYNILVIMWPMQAHSSPTTTNAGLQHISHPNKGQQRPMRANKDQQSSCQPLQVNERASGDGNVPR